jgi:hypothetical protein
VADQELVEAKFLKSGRNRRTENAGLSVLLRDPRFQSLPLDLKIQILAELGAAGSPPQAFDAVMTPTSAGPITSIALPTQLPSLTLIEMKTTQKPIRDTRLEGYFFGVTQSELDLASRLGDRYAFAFVVLNSANVFGHPFFVILSLEQLEQRIRSKRTQYQVTLGRGIADLMVPIGSGPGTLIPAIASPRDEAGQP